jgi:adenylate cyclase
MERRLAAVLIGDVVGYGRLSQLDEEGTRARFQTDLHEIFEPKIAAHRGRLVKTMGDGLLIEFASVVDAIRCAIELQRSKAERNAGVPKHQRLVYRIGINLGDVIVEGDDIHGDGVNIAARLQGLAEPGGIAISGTAYDHVKTRLPVGYADLGEQTVKSIAEPVRVYRVLLDPREAGRTIPKQVPLPRIKSWRWQMATAAVIAFVIAVGAAAWLRPWQPRIESASVERMALPLPDKPSIAVLPFTNMSGDPQQQYFSDGITEDIITELSRFRSLFVIARNSSFQYRDKATDVTRIGRELGVQYVVEGSVRRSSDRIRITAQLIDVTTANHLWAERYDRDLQDTFAVQDEVTRTIVSTLAIRLEDERLAAAKRKPPENMLAYDYWLRGKNCLDLWNRPALFDARAFFEKAIEIDPGYARAYAGLALTYEWAAFYSAWGGGDPTAHEKAERHALKAASLDGTDYQPHIALGWIYQERRDFERSRRHLDRAEALNPNDADMLINKAMILSAQGDADRAIVLAQSAIRLNPYHPDWYLGYYSHCLMIARRYDEAMELRALATSTLPEARVYTAILCVLLGRMDEARRHVDALMASFSSHWLGEPTVGFFVKLMGGYKNQSDADIFREALRKAGLPE